MNCNCCKDTGYVMGNLPYVNKGGRFKGVECKKCDYWQKQKDDAKNWKVSKELTDLFKF